MPMGMMVRDLLDRKYAAIERENAIRAQEATSAGMLRAAQANQANVASGLLPGQAEVQQRVAESQIRSADMETGLMTPKTNAEIALRNAQTAGMTVETAWKPKLYQAEIGLQGAQAVNARASAGLSGAQTGQIARQRTLLDDILERPAVSGAASPAATGMSSFRSSLGIRGGFQRF